MPLTLTIRNASQLDNGSPLSLVLDRRGAMIGRAATCDWCLPDPALHISSRHAEIRFANETYELIDISTNGTFLAGQSARLDGPHQIRQGDIFLVGQFEVAASLDEASAAAAAEANAGPPPPPEWQGWKAAGGGGNAPPADPDEGAGGGGGWGSAPVNQPAPSGGGGGGGGGSSGWSSAPSRAATPTPSGWSSSSEWGGSSQPGPSAPPSVPPAPGQDKAWPPPPPTQEQAPKASPWNSAAPPPSAPASAWSSPQSAPLPPSGDDVWGKFAASNVVDWARGGFGQAKVDLTPTPNAPGADHVPSATSDPLGLGSPAPSPSAPPAAPQSGPAPNATAHSGGPQGQPPSAQPSPAAPPAPGPAPAAPSGGGGIAALASAAQLDPARLGQGEQETLQSAGSLLYRLISGLVVLLEARARAKDQMGAQGTSLEFDGNNPLKFARTPEQALVQLLNAPERGFMSTEQAVEDAFKDLQAHQMATLMAMQGALRATLDRFSPDAIRKRAENTGVISKILPGARDAALWKAYEKEFGGVAQGSDEAFMDMFAKEFRRAYEEMARNKR